MYFSVLCYRTKRLSGHGGFEMLRSYRGALFFLLAALTISSAQAAPGFGPPLQTPETWQGRIEMEQQEGQVALALFDDRGGIVRRFSVEAALPEGFPASFEAQAAEVLAWEGNLVIVASEEGQAFHFAIPAIDQQIRRSARTRGLKLEIDPEELDRELAAQHRLIRVDTARVILSKGGPAAELPFGPVPGMRGIAKSSDIGISIDTPPADPPGVGSCMRSCTADCGDGSSCSITCGPNRCGYCTCPLSCGCR